MPASEWVPFATAAIGVGGTMSVAIFNIVSTARRDRKQREHDAQLRAEQWDRDSQIRIAEVEESRATRQQERLAEAIVSYGEAVKNQSRICALLGANAGLTHYSLEKIDPDEAEKLLAQYERDRTIEFERLLLFADADLQRQARAWAKAVRKASAIREGLSVVPAEQFADLMNAASSSRDQFYACARSAVGVTTPLDPTPRHDLNTPGILPAAARDTPGVVPTAALPPSRRPWPRLSR